MKSSVLLSTQGREGLKYAPLHYYVQTFSVVCLRDKVDKLIVPVPFGVLVQAIAAKGALPSLQHGSLPVVLVEELLALWAHVQGKIGEHVSIVLLLPSPMVHDEDFRGLQRGQSLSVHSQRLVGLGVEMR